MQYTKLMSILDDCCKNQTTIIIEWDNGCIFKSDGSTGTYEANNPADPDEEAYVEYYACAVHISEIIRMPNSGQFNPDFGELCLGEMMEISELNEPMKITSAEGFILWKKE